MDATTKSALTAEQASLQAKLRARAGKPGYAANCVAIQKRLDAIARQLANG